MNKALLLHPSIPRMIVLCLVAVLAISVSAVGAQPAEPQEDCVPSGQTGYSICEPFLAFWEANDGADLFGQPLTEAYEERSSDTLDLYTVQYFERARIEHHPENAETPYEFSLGRLGSETLEYADGVDWMSLPKGDPAAAHYFDATGHTIASEFWDTYRSQGIDLGDEGISLRESVGLFGYPISEATEEPGDAGATRLVQWFERARFEYQPGEAVVISALGEIMTGTDDGFSPRIQREFDANLVYWREALGVPGIMAGIWVPGVGEWRNVAGVADRDTGEPLSFDHHVRIGSITKTFTGTLILQLADQGLLSLDDPVSMYLNGVPNGDAITLRHLAEMTSGLASFTFDPDFQEELFSNPDRAWQPQEMVDIGYANTEAGCPYAPENWPACFEPGTSFFYSNTNTVMLGMVVEQVTGMTYAGALQEMIFDPLGLEDTIAPADGSDVLEPFARGYTFQGLPDDATEQQEATFWNPSWGFAVGNLISSFDDLHVWARALGAGELLSAEMQAERLKKLPPGFGVVTEDRSYGFAIGYQSGWWGHEGELPGYNAIVYYRPDVDAVIAIAVNSDAVPYQGQFVSPAGTLADVLIEIGAREAPLGEFDSDIPYEVIP